MDPATTFCPNVACPARGHTGQGTMGLHSCKDTRFLCTECHTTCSATHGMRSPADLCGDGAPCGDAAGPRGSTPRDRRGVWR